MPVPDAETVRFLDHFPKGEDNDWDLEPRVWMHFRRPFSSTFELRKELTTSTR